MRTTLAIDDDILEQARHLAEGQHKPFRLIVNEALRVGLAQFEKTAKSRRYQTKPHAMGLRQGYDLDNIQEVLDLIEGEQRR